MPKDDPAAWARAVGELVTAPDRLAEMGAAGLCKAAEFAWPRIAERVLEVYSRVTA